MNRITAGLLAGGAALGLVCGAAAPARATLEMQTKAKKAGIAAANCQYCHNEKLPRKGASTNNDRGKWLVAQKEAKQAKEIDVAWLKEYVEKK
jgi:hypothetical protein